MLDRPKLVTDLPDPPEMTERGRMLEDKLIERLYQQERAWRELMREKKEAMEVGR